MKKLPWVILGWLIAIWLPAPKFVHNTISGVANHIAAVLK